MNDPVAISLGIAFGIWALGILISPFSIHGTLFCLAIGLAIFMLGFAINMIQYGSKE